ncbi:hypothetical protein [Halosimplex pelagicum]|uniref:Uncharacterized protein n=1 Tax=Halosimplex pelagicum TaxID=869886 RepID=A0A7D5T426_9EURY|nr:hypothetical protein [Halosimplex pelagicum]QLH82331.1 hypothetical protein HZS54_12215 [Halosimplex pelagicum]
MVDDKENQAGRTRTEPAPEYDAPVLALEITDEALSVFGEPVYGDQISRDDGRVTYIIKSRDPDQSSGEIRISLKERGDSEPELAVDGTPAVGSGISMSINGPVSEWALAQTVDDHNLLTELVFQGEPVFSVYGPPAKLGPSDIVICGDSGDGLLIPEEHRR